MPDRECEERMALRIAETLSASGARPSDASGRIPAPLQREIGNGPRSTDKRKHEALAELLDIGVSITTLDRRTLYVNGAMTRITGYTESELLEQPVYERYADRSEVDRFYDLLATEGRVRGFEAAGLRKDRTLYHVSASAVIVRTDDATPDCVIATLEDISELRRTEQALVMVRESMDATREATYWLASNGTIVYVNQAGCRALGYTRDELLETSLAALNPELSPEGWAQWWREIKANKSILVESELQTKDGALIPVEIRGSYFESNGKEFCHGSIIDLTERRRAEKERHALQEQLLHAQKMESVGRLAGGIAHDFNNMLGVILGQSELMLQDHALSAPLRADLQQICDAALRSVELTRQLLAFARRQTANPKVLDLNATVSEMLGMLRRLMGESIELDWRPGKGLWRVRIDPSQLHQILANLCVNAHDAITGHGKITMVTENTSFDERHGSKARTGDYVKLEVSDTGCGMSDEAMSHLFEPFFTTKDPGCGTGLGLASVYGIVQQNLGSIDVESHLGRGTTFAIYWPRNHGDVPLDSGGTATPPAQKGGETILLVEDEPSVCFVEQRMMERLGYEVLVAHAPGDAIQLVEERGSCIDLVVLDVIMPQMNGRALAERLTELRPGLRTLFVSGYPANVIADFGVLGAGIHFLEKPLTVHALSAKIREVLGS